MPAFKTLAPALVLLGLLAARQATAEPCNTTFFDAISGANSDTGLFEQGLSLAGAKDKLPDPNALPVTILVPNNKAWFDLMFKNGFFLRQISDLGPMLTGLMTYHILPQPLSPDQVKQEGKAQSLYGLLTGQDMPLTHYAKFDDGQLLFMGRPDGEEIAGVVETIQVCNSWVYIVDEVLKPTVDLSDVAQVDLSTISSIGGATSGGSASPQPSPSPSPEATPSTPADGSNGGSTEAPAAAACDKTFAQVAGETPGLSILKTVVSQSQFAGALPDPSGNYTLFAPTDNAFFSLLTTYNLSITDALALGDRLTSVLLYHVAVGALTPDQLAKETSLTTGLALKTQDSQYTIGVSTADGKTSVSGRAPGNTAAIQQNLAVCGSQVYVIDKVLVPSPALDAIPAVSGGLTSTASTPSAPASPAASPTPPPEAEPSPSPAAEAAPSPSPAPAPSPSPAPEPSPSPAPVPSAPSPAAPAPQPAQPAEAGTSTNALSGVALGTGYLQGCEVQLVRDGETLKSATSDGSGRFSFDCGADCTTLGASLKLPAAGQQAGCADSLTKLPPPFDVLAPVSALPLGVDQPLALSPLTTIIATASRPAVSTSSLPAVPAPEPAPTNRKLLQGGAARAPAPQPVASGANKLNPDFAIAEDSGNASSSMVSTEYGDLLKAALGGDLMAYKLLSSNQELMCAGSVSGTLLSALAGGEGTTAAQASQALFNQLAKDLLAGSPFNLTDAASVEGLLGRALAELTSGSSGSGTPAGVDAKAAQSAAASTLTLVNSLLEQAVATAESSQMKDGADKLVELLARLTKVCQASIAPAASQLGSGQLSVEAWQQQFGLDRIRDLAVAAQI